MSSRTSLRWIPLSAAITALGALSMGCGGVDPGDYVIYRVAFSEANFGGDCGLPDPNTANDSSSFLSASTFILYAGLEDSYYLDSDGNPTLEGTLDSDVYKFEGESTDITFSGPNGTGDKLTSSNEVDLDITVDGESISGTLTSQVRSICNGACPAFVPTSCTTTTDFIGTEVEEITLEYGL